MADDDDHDDWLDWEPPETSVTAWSTVGTTAGRNKRRGAYGSRQPRGNGGTTSSQQQQLNTNLLKRANSLPVKAPSHENFWTGRAQSSHMNDDIVASPTVARKLPNDIFSSFSNLDPPAAAAMPSPRPFRRSHSLALGTTTSSRSISDSVASSGLSFRDSDGSSSAGLDIGENVDPNWQNRRIRKIKARRRASTQGTEYFRSSPLLSGTPPRVGLTSPTSVSSNRKRSPPSNDLENEDDFASLSTSSTARRIRSRSRLLDPEDLIGTLPFAPSLDMFCGNLSVASINAPTPAHSSRRGASMDMDSDSDSTGGSPDTSIDDDLNKSHASDVAGTAQENGADSPSPSDPADVTFLISALHKEKRSVYCQSWNIVAPQKWSNQRRTTFFAWAQSLGFALRPIGNGLFIASISKSRGKSVLERLESGTRADPVPIVHPVQIKRQSTPQFTWPDSQADDLALGLAAMTVQEESVTVDTTASTLVDDEHLISVRKDKLASDSRDSLDICSNKELKLCLLSSETPRRPPKQSLVRSSYGSLSMGTPLPADGIVETPLNNARGWGSRPVNGRDWGISCQCNEESIAALKSWFEECQRVSGVQGSSEVNSIPLIPSSFDGCESDDRMDMTPPPDKNRGTAPFFESEGNARTIRRRLQSVAKFNRVSICAAALQKKSPRMSLQRKSIFLSYNNNTDPIVRPSLLPHDEFGSSSSSIDLEDLYPSSEPVALALIFEFLDERELLCTAGLVCSSWADAATEANGKRMLASVEYLSGVDDDADHCERVDTRTSLAKSMEWPWKKLVNTFPWGRFLSEGSFKQVFLVQNATVNTSEAVSVMDVDAITDKKTVGAELEVSALLSSLARRGICPNFIITRRVFTCPYAPPASRWGSSKKKCPQGSVYDEAATKRPLREPKRDYPGRYQYIGMELCSKGDAEEFLKTQTESMLSPEASQMFLFQIAFALHAAADRYSLKHYDLKMLNVFVQDITVPTEDVVLRYALGSHVFALRMATEAAVFAKLADYGTANICAQSNGQPVTIAQFTTLENTPPDFLILGDEALQGHGHDNFGLGLCMLHLFTGDAPYEEILEEVVCPPNLKKRLRKIWENEKIKGYDAVRSVILADVYKDEVGNIVEGEPDEILYDTLYRYLVLFGIPDKKYEQKKCPLVWKAIYDVLCGDVSTRVKQAGNDVFAYTNDCHQYSLLNGSHVLVKRARVRLESMPGGMELLFALCCFDPKTRATAMDVLNSRFMANLRESGAPPANPALETVYNYTAFATK